MSHTNKSALSEYALHQDRSASFQLLAHLLAIYEEPGYSEQERNLHIHNLLQRPGSTHLLQMLCNAHHLDHVALIDRLQEQTNYHIGPILVLHLICLPLDYVADALELDKEYAAILVAELKANFHGDDPMYWLKSLLQNMAKTQQHYQRQQQELHGLQATNQAHDTHEDRKLRDRKLKPRNEPHN